MMTLAADPLVNEMGAKIAGLWPELLLVVAAFVVMIVGLSPRTALRQSTFGITFVALALAGVLAAFSPEQVTGLAVYTKIGACVIGLLLLLALAELPDELGQNLKDGEGRFDPQQTHRGEFFGFFLLSITGVMLCAGADDLIWLFLALELTSLPTYVMVSISRRSIRAPEAGVKYFFLGALAAATFLYGFALIYGATGTTYLSEIGEAIARDGLTPLATAGFVIAILGISFKIAAVPMHFYAADVYEGAATPVTAFLAFVPKAAGFLTLILILDAAGWPVFAGDGMGGDGVVAVVWILAALTMVIGNVMALLQTNIKRVLAYSSIAHSGYMMVGLLAGPGNSVNGVSAVLFYLIAYGVMNVGAFAVIGLLKRAGEEAETFDDLKGLAARRPVMAAAFAVCLLSLTGIPPLIGFWGKLYLFSASISMGYVGLTVIALMTSAVAAYYYLRMIATCYLIDPDRREQAEISTLPQRSLALTVSAGLVVLLSIGVGPLFSGADGAANGFGKAETSETAKPEQGNGAKGQSSTEKGNWDDERLTSAAGR